MSREMKIWDKPKKKKINIKKVKKSTEIGKANSLQKIEYYNIITMKKHKGDL